MLNRPWKTGVTVGFVIVAALLAAVAVAGTVTYFKAARDGVITLLRRSDADRTEAVRLGAVQTETLLFSVPWGQRLRGAEFKVQPGAVAVGPVAIRLLERGWGEDHYEVLCRWRAYRTGELEPGTVAVSFDQPQARGENRRPGDELTLAKLTVLPAEVAADAELPIAGALMPPSPPVRWPWYVGGALALLLVALLFLKARRAGTVPERRLEPWEAAELELATLRRQVVGGERNLSWCFARLTDVVRDYLAERFALPVTRQTTTEFLHSLKRRDTPLTEAQGVNLAEFMTAADMVKFAGEKPEGRTLERAIDKAEALVRETRLDPENHPGGTR